MTSAALHRLCMQRCARAGAHAPEGPHTVVLCLDSTKAVRHRALSTLRWQRSSPFQVFARSHSRCHLCLVLEALPPAHPPAYAFAYAFAFACAGALLLVAFGEERRAALLL